MAKATFFEAYREQIVDVLSRAGKTFVQTLTGQLTVAALVGGNYGATKAALVAAVSAGISVIWNALSAWANNE